MYGRPKFTLFLLRLALGWVFLYAGVTKILDHSWSASGFLLHARTFPDLYSWFAHPANIGWVNFLVRWGEVAVGLGLILGILAPIAASAGILMLILFYFPGLHFPYVGEQGFLINEQVVYILALWLIVRTRAGSFWSIRNWWGGGGML